MSNDNVLCLKCECKKCNKEFKGDHNLLCVESSFAEKQDTVDQFLSNFYSIWNAVQNWMIKHNENNDK